MKPTGNIWKKEDIYVPLEMIKTNISKSTKLLNVVRDRSSFLDPERYPEKLIAIEEIITHFRDSFN